MKSNKTLESEDLKILLKILKGVAHKNQIFFSNYLEQYLKKVLDKLGGDYQRESETISAMLLTLVSLAAYLPLVLPTIVSCIVDILSWETISRLMNAYILVN